MRFQFTHASRGEPIFILHWLGHRTIYNTLAAVASGWRSVTTLMSWNVALEKCTAHLVASNVCRMTKISQSSSITRQRRRLLNVLRTAREVTKGKIITSLVAAVIAIAGKRAPMGEAAPALAMS